MIFKAATKIPNIIKLNLPKLMNVASRLVSNGKLAVSDNKLVYLDIDDAYVHQLFPLLQNKHVKKPDYFGEKSAGAHITVMYPQENKTIKSEDLNQAHSFRVMDIVTADIDCKVYYVLLVESASLLELRRRYGLADQLCFKGYSIDFHITIGVIGMG